MPIYGYICNKCGHDFQTLVRFRETPFCPSCGGADLARQLSLIAAPAKNRDVPMCSAADGGCGMPCPGMCN
jgi:putative FmdB family regulatory protein